MSQMDTRVTLLIHWLFACAHIAAHMEDVTCHSQFIVYMQIPNEHTVYTHIGAHMDNVSHTH